MRVIAQPRLYRIACAALLLASCGAAAPPATAPFASAIPNKVSIGNAAVAPTVMPVTAVIASSDLATGNNLRFAVALLRPNGKPILNATVTMQFFLVQANQATAETRPLPASFYGEGLNDLGLYVVHTDFKQAGSWGVQINIDTGSAEPFVSRIAFQIADHEQSIPVGAPAPHSHNRTATPGMDLKQITSDPRPDPDLYRLTVADAGASGKPTLVVFATPTYCQSRVCGPTLEVAKKLKAAAGDRANAIHIEVYSNFQTLEYVPEMAEWGLPSEPWIFFLDRKGNVAAKFDGGLTTAELLPVWQQVLAQN